jgi:signal transduction histidine kinase
MKSLFPRIVAAYGTHSYAARLQAKYLRIINMLILLILPALVAANEFMLNSRSGFIRLTLLALWMISLFELWLLRKGKLALAGQLFLWTFLVGLWTVMFVDLSDEVIVRIDTIVFGVTILSTIPLLTLTHRFQLWLLHIVNFILFILFCYKEYRLGSMTELVFRDFVTDTSVALIFLAVISNAIYTANGLAMARIREDMIQVDRTRLLLNRTVNAMPSVLMSVDETLKVTGWNDEAEKLTGTPATRAMNSLFSKVFTLFPEWNDIVQQVALGSSAVEKKKQSLYKNDEERLYNFIVYPLIPEQPNGAVIRLDDVTEQAAFESMMVQTEKMLSVGGLAAGMAHEINNPLAGILQNTQVIRNRLTDHNEKNMLDAAECGLNLDALDAYLEKKNIHRLFDAVTGSGMQAAKVVDNVLSFARKEDGTQTTVDAGVLIEDTLALVRNDYNLKTHYDFRKIEVVFHRPDTALRIHCKVSMIQQVLLNILRNGAQAMSSAGVASPRIDISLSSGAGMVEIRIADSGPGIEKEVQSRIFEPFFTTRSPDDGTGLGLSVSFFIVTEAHNGFLDVHSTPGEGAVFCIRLPACQEEPNESYGR